MYLGASGVVRTSRGERWSLASLNSTMMSLKGEYECLTASVAFPLCFQAQVLALFCFQGTSLNYRICLVGMCNAHLMFIQ